MNSEAVTVTLSAVFGLIGSVLGIVAAVLWLHASRISWTTGREPGMLPGDYGPHSGKWWTTTYYIAQEPYLEAVGKWNRRAARATAASMFLWACQTLGGLAPSSPPEPRPAFIPLPANPLQPLLEHAPASASAGGNK